MSFSSPDGNKALVKVMSDCLSATVKSQSTFYDLLATCVTFSLSLLLEALPSLSFPLVSSLSPSPLTLRPFGRSSSSTQPWNAAVPQSPALALFSHCSGDPIWQGPANSPHFFLQPAPSPEVQIHYNQGPSQISTWIPNNHLPFNMSKTWFLITLSLPL